MISVVMVSYWTGPALDGAVAAVLAEPGAAQLILVDNGNPPKVTAALAAQAAAEPRLTLVTGHGNLGFAAGCNLGARHARGDVLLLLNPDARLEPGALARLSDEATALPRPFVIGGRIVDAQGREQRGGRRHPLTPLRALVEGFGLYRLGLGRWRLNRHQEPAPAAPEPMGAVSGAVLALPVADYWALGGLDAGYFLHVEDLDLCWRMHAAGGRVVYAPSVAAVHAGGTSAAPPAFVERHKARGFSRYFRIHRPKTLWGGLVWGALAWVVVAGAYGRAWWAGMGEGRAQGKAGRNGPGA